MQATRQLGSFNGGWNQVAAPGLYEVVNQAIRLREETLGGLWQRFRDAASQYLAFRVTVAELRQLDDRTLADIGLRREGLETALRQRLMGAVRG